MTPRRVLVVDDDEAVLQTFAKALGLEGYDVRVAASPLVGLHQAQEAQPDAILLDLQMPFVNGLGFLYRLRANPILRHIPVAIITGDTHVDQPMMEELRELDADIRFKPVWIDEMLDLTSALLARSPAGA